MVIPAHDAALRIRRVLERVTYRPDSRIYVREYGDLPESITLDVRLMVRDTYHPEQVREISHTFPVHAMMIRDDADVIRFLRRCLHAVEAHESDEWLKVDGVPIFDPHVDNAEHDRRLEAVTHGKLRTEPASPFTEARS